MKALKVDGAGETSGQTPTAAALRSALESLACGADSCTANLDRIGACGIDVPNCCDPVLSPLGPMSPTSLCLDDAAVTEQLELLRAAGIKTFIVGLPGTEPYAANLAGFAQAGGTSLPGQTSNYFAVDGGSAFRDALSAITDVLVPRCEVPLDASPKDLTRINLAIDCTPIPQRQGEVINWAYAADKQSILVMGPKCEMLKTYGARRIDVILDCTTLVVP